MVAELRNLVVLSCALISCGPASKRGDTGSTASSNDPTPESACQAPCRVVVGGLKRPVELVADGSSVYVAERAEGDTYDAVLLRVPQQGGATVKVTAAPSMLGLARGGTNLFWRRLNTASGIASSIERVSVTGGTPTSLFEGPSSIGIVVADDDAVYGATTDEVFSVSIAEGKKATLGKVVGLTDLVLSGPDVLMVDRGPTMPTQAELDDPAATRPCLVDWVPKTGGAIATAYAATPVHYTSACNPSSIAPFDLGVVWLGPSTTGEGTALFKLDPSASVPRELAKGLSSDYGAVVTDEDYVYFTYRTQEDDTVFARCSRTGEVTTLWSGAVHPGGMAASGGSLYFTAFERSEDGKRTHGAVLAIPGR